MKNNEEKDREPIREMVGEQRKLMSSVIGKCTGLRGWIRKNSESKGSSSVDKMEGDGEFDNKQKYSIKDKKQLVLWELC